MMLILYAAYGSWGGTTSCAALAESCSCGPAGTFSGIISGAPPFGPTTVIVAEDAAERLAPPIVKARFGPAQLHQKRLGTSATAWTSAGKNSITKKVEWNS